MPVCQRALSPSRSFRRTWGSRSMLRTYPAFMPCSAPSQNWFPIRPSPTGVRRGLPVFRPFVSSNAYPGSARPIASELDWRVQQVLLKRVFDPMFHFESQNALKRIDLMIAIGAGIGNNGAHEIGHQFFLDGHGMDDSSKNTYNGQGCDGEKSRCVYGFGPIQ